MGSPEIENIGRLAIGGNELWWLCQGDGAHGEEPSPAETVISSLNGTFRFVEETAITKGLWAPQLGALHAILAHRSMETAEPITIVMPTGTGKTETMLATYCYSPRRTLVIVPSDALRTQIARKFTTLGVLPAVGAVTGDFRCPVVLVLRSALTTIEDVDDVVSRANVVVATAQALTGCTEAARTRLLDLCAWLVVDEAHHVAARTWRSVTELFGHKEIVQFTATPYR